MSNIVISARGLGKSYLIGHKKTPTGSLRDRIVDSVAGMRRNIGRTLSGKQLLAGDNIEEFWALRDVDFDIKHGEAVGIIGRNGAGKSTLLKVLSRITEPTTGRVEIRGRVASLLEVGTGFHPELTGRENIFLNGAILGMTRAEIRRRFDEIVDFAGVEKFLDTPVKRYSSGMYVRLAFAVAAHLEPEILVVDEVLAVGDAEFQKKCLGKMQDVAGEGRTVLFVSHNMAAVQRLCSKGILLGTGRVAQSGNIDACLDDYSKSFATEPQTEVRKNGLAASLRLEGAFDGMRNAVRAGERMLIIAEFVNDTGTEIDGEVLVTIRNSRDRLLSQLSTASSCQGFRIRSRENRVCFEFQRTPFSSGVYEMNLIIRSHGVELVKNVRAARFVVVGGKYYATDWNTDPHLELPLVNYTVSF